MKRSRPVLAGILVITSLIPVLAAQLQVRVIDLYRGRAVGNALQILRERYRLPISYEGPVYACSCDLADMTYTRKTPGPPIIVPKRQRLHFEYAEMDGKPQEGITQLIRRLLAEHATQGGPVFELREHTTSGETAWDVVALKARGSSGDFVDQPDILGAPIYMPKARRSEPEFLNEVAQQLTTETGYHVVASYFVAGVVATFDVGAENVPARELLLNVYGTSEVWDLEYEPESSKYFLNIGTVPQPPMPLNAFTVPTPHVHPTGPVHLPSGAVLREMTTEHGRIRLQSALAQAGYYTGALSGEWDAKTTDALRKFQAANNIPVTGKPDPETIRKLGLDVVAPLPQ